jgi:uridine kinase
MATVETDVVGPLRSSARGRYRRYDWHHDRFAEEVVVEPVDVLVVEGVGAGNRSYADAITCLVWVETPSEERTARGLARDGVGVRDHWAAWQAQEAEMFAEHGIRERADAVVDGLSGAPVG